MKFNMIKTENGLKPANETDRVSLGKVKYNDVLRCTTIDQRNYMFHRKFFAMLKLAFMNMPEKYGRNFPTMDALRSFLIISAGWNDSYLDLQGNVQYQAKSVSFDKMKQSEFEELYSAVIDVILQYFIPIERTEFELEILNFSG